MNREILFRGRSINHNWHTGLLSISQGKTGQPEKGYYISNSSGMPWAYQVDPKTVGQFTGLLDKNGKKIFEGDRAKLKFHTASYVCKWSDKFCALLWECEVTDEFRTMQEESEIIGNITDDPEL